MNADMKPEKAATGSTRTYLLGNNVESFRALSLRFTHFSRALCNYFLWLLCLTFWKKTSYVDGLLTLGTTMSLLPEVVKLLICGLRRTAECFLFYCVDSIQTQAR